MTQSVARVLADRLDRDGFTIVSVSRDGRIYLCGTERDDPSYYLTIIDGSYHVARGSERRWYCPENYAALLRFLRQTIPVEAHPQKI